MRFAPRSITIDPKFDDGVGQQLAQRAMKANAVVDAMPSDLRKVVHEFGYAAVQACLLAGVTQPAKIRHLILEIWAGARAPNQQRTGSGTNRAINHLDWLLVQQACPVGASTLLSILADHHHVLVPKHATGAMIDASLATVANHNLRVTKREKHQLRLDAAIKAHIDATWPEVRV